MRGEHEVKKRIIFLRKNFAGQKPEIKHEDFGGTNLLDASKEVQGSGMDSGDPRMAGAALISGRQAGGGG